MEGAGLGGRESSVAELGAGVRIRRAVRQQVLGPFQFALYGDEVREFITMEHCGDDFLAELVETMRDSKDWDDLQAAKSEACGVLADMFGQDIRNDGECNVVQDVDIVEDSPQPKKNQTFLEDCKSTVTQGLISVSNKNGKGCHIRKQCISTNAASGM